MGVDVAPWAIGNCDIKIQASFAPEADAEYRATLLTCLTPPCSAQVRRAMSVHAGRDLGLTIIQVRMIALLIDAGVAVGYRSDS